VQDIIKFYFTLKVYINEDNCTFFWIDYNLIMAYHIVSME